MDLLIEKCRYRMKNLKQIVMFKGVSVSVAEWKHYRRQFCTRRASFCRRPIGLDVEQSRVRKITDCCSFNRPLHNAPLPAVSSAPLASDPKKWLQPNPKVLSISCQKTCRCCVWSKPVYFKLTGFGFGERKLTQRSKRSFETQDPVLII